jgi:hypothetical protein
MCRIKRKETAFSASRAGMMAFKRACRVFPKGSKCKKSVTKSNNLLFVLRPLLS